VNAEQELVLALLLASHLLADFIFQTRAMVERKGKQWPWMAAHGLEVLLVQGLVLFPFVPGARTVQALAAIAASHVCIDVLKVRLETWAGRRLAWFVLDQLLHFPVLALATHWLALGAPAIERRGFSPHGLRSRSPASTPSTRTAARPSFQPCSRARAPAA
jgi:hypothetical protein